MNAPDLRHYSIAAEVVPYSVTQGGERARRDKPDGLWVSVEDGEGWSTWCSENEWDCGPIAHEVTLADDAKILWLTSAADVLDFHADHVLPDSRGWGVNWPTIAETWQGIFIAPYQWSLRLSLEVGWYYTWDCSSGCIWDASAIAAIRPLVRDCGVAR